MSTQSTQPTEMSPDEILRLNALAEEVEIDTIQIGERIRRDFSHVPGLADSIRENGLIQPIVLTHDRKLIAGESRIRAHRSLGLKTIRAVFRGVLDEAQLHILECEENNARQALTWQERCLSVDRVHRYKSLEALQRGQRWGVRETGDLLKQGKTQIGLVVAIAEALHANNEAVWKADGVNDAWKVILKQKEEEALRLIVLVSTGGKAPTTPAPKPVSTFDPSTLTIPKVDFFGEPVNLFTPGITGPEVTDELPGQAAVEGPMVVPLSTMYLQEKGGHNSLGVMASLGASAVDHIITDPPYAIDMDNLQQSQGGQDVTTVAKEHDVVENTALLSRLIPQAYITLRDRGFFIFWCDPTMWMDLCNQCTAAGFRVQKWPLIWHKTSACSNQSASTNFTKNIEFAVVARKGNATLISQQPSCVYTGGNDMETRLLGHPFAKPEGLWSWVYKAVTQKGQTVLDPFVGVGSSVIPAIRLGLRPTGIECNEVHYGRGLVNVMNLYKTIDTNATFT